MGTGKRVPGNGAYPSKAFTKAFILQMMNALRKTLGKMGKNPNKTSKAFKLQGVNALVTLFVTKTPS